MPTMRPNALRVKRFRDLKADLRTHRNRLLVGIDIAKAQHVAQVRLAHTRILDKHVTVPNTQAGFERFWAHLERRQTETGVPELVCAVEPTGTYHQALAQFLETQGADVLLVDNHGARLHRRMLDRTWEKSDPKDAHNLCDLLEQGRVLFCALPEEPLASLRRLVRLLRRARVEWGACKARWQNTLRPALGPAGELLPPTVVTALPAGLRALLPAAERAGGTGRPRTLAPGLAAEVADLAARCTAVQARLRALEEALVTCAGGHPALPWLRSIPGLGPTLSAICLAEIGDITWDHQVQPAPQARGARHRPAPVGAVGGDGADLAVWPATPPLGPLPSRPRGRSHPDLAGQARCAAREARGGSARVLQSERGARREAPPGALGGLAERAAVHAPPGAGDLAAFR